ncbi:tetratricopeptide repeat protein, partial [Tumidithrix elongata RA019]|nr:tetratricopeptide repeat protein [Tumidithrix elongata RA019]
MAARIYPLTLVLASSLWGIGIDLPHAIGAANQTTTPQSQISDNKPIAQNTTTRKAEADRLYYQGIQQWKISQFEAAVQSWQQTLTIYRDIKDRQGEGSSLTGLGLAYQKLGKYDNAIECHLQALAIDREIKYKLSEGWSLGNLGLAYYSLGKYDKAIEYQQQSLAIAREIKERLGESIALGNLGLAYYSLGKYDKAIEYHLQSLAIAREIKERLGEGQELGNLGLAYQKLNKYDKAIEYYLQSLAISREIKDRSGESHTLNNLGIAYRELNRDREAMTSFQQALTIAREIGARSVEGYALGNLGNVLSKVKQPELAILFYKQSVNVREAIRKDLRKLDKDIQKSYLDTVEKTYRELADLLLKQDRVLEAQQVLDLLKVQELSDYLKTVRGNEQTAKGTDLQRPEQTIIALGNELADLQKLDRLGKLDPVKQQRLAYLTSQESDRNQQFNAFLKSPEVQKQIEQLRRTEQAQNVDIEKFNRLRKSLAQVQNAALLYPLILDDRFELILITATTPPIRRTINLKREVLNAAIVEFRANLRDPSSFDVRKDGQKFYDWLIHPFDAELQQAKVQTIIYAPDGQLRYIPLAALYDGKQWLVEKYRINNITASSLTDFAPRPHNNPRVLAAAATNSQNIQVGDRSIP